MHDSRLQANNKFAALSVQQVAAKVKIPPLFTKSKEVAVLRNELAAKQIHPLFKLCGVGTKIICSTEEDYKAVGKHLLAQKQEFYTHDNPGSKPLKVVIRGLPEFTPETIIAELKANNLKPVNVFPIKRAVAEHRDKLYLVHLEKGSITLAELKKIKAIFNIIVEWERYRPKHNDVTQCGNCLAFGHGTRNCHMLSRCGKCAEQHATEECQQMDEGTALKCVNCGGNHEGSNRTCPKRAEFIEIRRRASTRTQLGRQRRPPPPMTDEHFPVLRHQVPNLPPLQPNRRQTHPLTSVGHQSLVQPRLAAAAAELPAQPAGPSAWANPRSTTTPPGWGNTGVSAPINQPSKDGDLYTMEQMAEYVRDLLRQMRTCRTREEQLNGATMVVLNFINKHGDY